MKKWLIPLIVLISAYVLFSGELIIQARERLLYFFRRDNLNTEIEYLRNKNQALEIEIFNLRNNNVLLDNTEDVNARVFARYPFTDRSKIIINIGSENGIEIGDTARINNTLIGRVETVYKRTSVIQTIFDSEFRIPVRIGTEELDALYVGGINPRLTMISTDALLQYGDLVVSASSDFPYGLGIGSVLQVFEGATREASVRPLFEIKAIRNVSISTD